MLARFGRTALSRHSGLVVGNITSLLKATPTWIAPLKNKSFLFSSDSASSSSAASPSSPSSSSPTKERQDERISSKSKEEFTVQRPSSGYTETVAEKEVWRPTLDSLYNETKEGQDVLSYIQRQKRRGSLKPEELPESYVPTYIPKKPTPLEDKVQKDHFEGDYVPDREESEFSLYEPSQEELEHLNKDKSEPIIYSSSQKVWKQEISKEGTSAAVGRRKRAVANVVLIPNGDGKVIVNSRLLPHYFPTARLRENVLAPYVVTETLGQFNTICNVTGGGISAQSVALSHGISRALQKWNPAYRPGLKIFGLLTRDSREVERKKPGQKKARKKFQWVKR